MILKFGLGYLFKSIMPVLILSGFYGNTYGQRFSVATNLLGYVNFGTINGEIGLGVSQNFTIYIQAKYNPFIYKYHNKEKQLQNKQLSMAAGARFWPWHLYSGWFISGQFGFSRYNRGGLVSQETFEGDAYGLTIGAGYALMIKKHLNLDFGVGIIGGITDYVKYRCPACGKIENSGKKLFVAPNNVLVQLSYLF